MEIKVGAIGKMTLLRYAQRKENFCGIILNTIPQGKENVVVFYTITGEEERFYTKNIINFSSIRATTEVRNLLKDYYQKYKTVEKELQVIAKQREKINAIQKDMEKSRYALLEIQHFLTENEFLINIRKMLGNICNDWEIGFDPDCCVEYGPERTLYFYREFVLTESYGAERSSLTFREYDNNLFMHSEYETMEEFMKYRNKYEKKIFSKLPILSLCYVSGKEHLVFKCVQKYVIGNDAMLTEELLNKIAKNLQNAV